MVPNFASEYYQISFILILAAFAIPISRKAAVADIPILIILGIIFGPVAGIIKSTFAQSFLTTFGYVGIGLLGIMIILYYESHHMNLRVLRHEFWKIASLDVVGVIATALIAGTLFSWIFRAPFGIGFLFGSIIAPTDPATLIPLFRRIKVKENISGVLIGESLFNDPISIVLVSISILLIAPDSSYVSAFSGFINFTGIYVGAVLYFIIQITVPAIIGIVIGFSVILMNKFLNFENLIVGLLLGIVILEFTIFEAVGITPFPAIIATGAVVGNFSDKSIFWNREENFQENLSFLSQAIIFLTLGSMLTRGDLTEFALLGLAFTILVIFLARPLSVFVSLGLVSVKKKERLNSDELSFLSLVGPRGVVSVVMATVPYTVGIESQNAQLIQYGGIMAVLVSFIVLFSIVLQTIYVPIIARKFLNRENVAH
ncbi:MAG TPA: sodium:proton antiporter [Thermoplasmataceae archaeon]|nr:sodium:proton antiporter [Thermoplasmatales archaeon AK]HLH85918.1 sodium:proton antiporter [Thermoplasmataceae archaeon]